MQNASVDTSGFVGYLGKFRHSNKSYASHSQSSQGGTMSDSNKYNQKRDSALHAMNHQAEITEHSTREAYAANEVKVSKAKISYKKSRRVSLKDSFN